MASRKVREEKKRKAATTTADGRPLCAMCNGRARAYLDELVERLQALPQVKQVLIDYSAGIPHTWVVIEAPRFELEYRKPIYLAELDVAQRYPDVHADLHLLNIVEYGSAHLSTVLPADAEVALSR